VRSSSTLGKTVSSSSLRGLCRRLTLDDAGISSYRPEIANSELHRIIPSPRIGSHIGCSLAFSPAARRCARCTTTDVRDSQFSTPSHVGVSASLTRHMFMASAARNTLLIYQMTDYCSKRSKVGSFDGQTRLTRSLHQPSRDRHLL
jgi:hypothetical protein